MSTDTTTIRALKKGKELLRQGNLAGSEKAFLSALERVRGSGTAEEAEAREGLGHCNLNKKAYERARAEFAEALGAAEKIDVSHSRTRVKRIFEARMGCALASLHMSVRDDAAAATEGDSKQTQVVLTSDSQAELERAANEVREALRVGMGHPEHEDHLTMIARANDLKGCILSAIGGMGNLDTALECFRTAIDRRREADDPFDVDLVFKVGDTLKKLGDLDQAADFYRETIEKHKDQELDVAVLRHELGVALIQLRKYTEAVAELEKSTSVRSAQRKEEEYENALEDLKAARLGETQQEEYDEALRKAEAAEERGDRRESGTQFKTAVDVGTLIGVPIEDLIGLCKRGEAALLEASEDQQLDDLYSAWGALLSEHKMHEEAKALFEKQLGFIRERRLGTVSEASCLTDLAEELGHTNAKRSEVIAMLERAKEIALRDDENALAERICDKAAQYLEGLGEIKEAEKWLSSVRFEGEEEQSLSASQAATDSLKALDAAPSPVAPIDVEESAQEESPAIRRRKRQRSPAPEESPDPDERLPTRKQKLEKLRKKKQEEEERRKEQMILAPSVDVSQLPSFRGDFVVDDRGDAVDDLADTEEAEEDGSEEALRGGGHDRVPTRGRRSRCRVDDSVMVMAAESAADLMNRSRRSVWEAKSASSPARVLRAISPVPSKPKIIEPPVIVGPLAPTQSVRLKIHVTVELQPTTKLMFIVEPGHTIADVVRKALTQYATTSGKSAAGEFDLVLPDGTVLVKADRAVDLLTEGIEVIVRPAVVTSASSGVSLQVRSAVANKSIQTLSINSPLDHVSLTALVNAIPELLSLMSADLSGTSITAPRVEKLANALGKLPLLSRLSLSRNAIGFQAEPHYTAIAELFLLPNLTQLEMSSCGITLSVFSGIVDSLAAGPRISKIKKLCLSKNLVGSPFPTFVQSLGPFRFLDDLDLEDTGIAGPWTQPIPRFPATLRAIVVRGNRLGDEGARFIASALPSEVRWIDASFTTLQAAGCRALLASGAKFVNLEGNHSAGTGLVAGIAEAGVPGRLVALCVSQCGLGAPGLAALLRKLPQCPSLQAVSAEDNRTSVPCNGQIARALKENPGLLRQLAFLNLTNNGISKEDADALIEAWKSTHHGRIPIFDAKSSSLLLGERSVMNKLETDTRENPAV